VRRLRHASSLRCRMLTYESDMAALFPSCLSQHKRASDTRTATGRDKERNGHFGAFQIPRQARDSLQIRASRVSRSPQLLPSFRRRTGWDPWPRVPVRPANRKPEMSGWVLPTIPLAGPATLFLPLFPRNSPALSFILEPSLFPPNRALASAWFLPSPQQSFRG